MQPTARAGSLLLLGSFFLRAGLFFGLHLPAWPSDSCSVCQLVASGTLRRGEFAGGEKKKEGGVRQGSANTSVFVRPSAQRGKNSFPGHYRVAFVQLVAEGMSEQSGLCLPCTGLHAGLLCGSRKSLY